MTRELLLDIQRRLGNTSNISQNLSGDAGLLNNMLYGGQRLDPSHEQVTTKKSSMKVDLAKLITELENIKNLID